MRYLNLRSTTAYIRQIVKDVTDGKIGIPAFQRSFMWKKNQIKDLFDSIKKGYPIGSVLLWDRKEKLETRDFITDKINNQGDYECYVLDGRQRLTVFYGCITNSDSSEKFKLCYNLRDDIFQYPNELKLKSHRELLIPISVIFDTFSLLDILQVISEKYKNDSNLSIYQKRAKELNAVLQEYQVVLITLPDCSMEEAYKVFSRINSKGTSMGKAEMLQASSYKVGEPLLADRINDIRKSLQKYNYEDLTQDDVLKCFYKFAGKNFYDQIPDIESLNLNPYIEQVSNAVLSATRFLYEKCNVISLKFLPYKKQFIALTWYFKEHVEYQEADFPQLKKWFFYTTIKNSFQNSSNSNVRKLFSDFESFVKGKTTQPIIYEDVKISGDYEFKMNLGSAKTDFLVLAWIYYYKKNNKISNAITPKLYRKGNGESVNYYILLEEEDQELLDYIFHPNFIRSININKGLEESIERKINSKYGLTKEIIYNYHYNYDNFKTIRTRFFKSVQEEIWKNVK